jgi:phage-related protein
VTDTLIPPQQPSFSGTSGSVKARMLSSKYGDGYKSDAPDGANPLDRTQTLAWDPILIDDAKTITDFLDAHVGTPFYYRLPRDRAPRMWVFISYDRTHPYPAQDALTVSLEERIMF